MDFTFILLMFSIGLFIGEYAACWYMSSAVSKKCSGIIGNIESFFLRWRNAFKEDIDRIEKLVRNNSSDYPHILGILNDERKDGASRYNEIKGSFIKLEKTLESHDVNFNRIMEALEELNQDDHDVNFSRIIEALEELNQDVEGIKKKQHAIKQPCTKLKKEEDGIKD